MRALAALALGLFSACASEPMEPLEPAAPARHAPQRTPGKPALPKGPGLPFNVVAYVPGMTYVYREQRLLEDRLKRESAGPDPATEKYLWLIVGDDEQRFLASGSLLYRVALENGFDPKRMYVLSSNGTATYLYPVDGAATRMDIELLSAHLAKKLGPEDALLIAMVDHGQRTPMVPIFWWTPREYFFCMGGEYLTPAALKRMLDPIKARKAFLLEFCYSGSFGELLALDGSAVVAASGRDETARGYVNLSPGGEFMQSFEEGPVNFGYAFKRMQERLPDVAAGRHSVASYGDLEQFYLSTPDMRPPGQARRSESAPQRIQPRTGPRSACVRKRWQGRR